MDEESLGGNTVNKILIILHFIIKLWLNQARAWFMTFQLGV